MFSFVTNIRKKAQALWDTKKIQTGGVFFVFNVVFPLVDLITDIGSAIELYFNKDQHWFGLTIFWMFGPFIFNILLYIIKIFKKSGNYTNGLIKVFLHFPFILPVTNTILVIHLLSFDLTNPKNSSTIETIKRTAAISGLYESYLESAPQTLTQIHIILSTGQFQVSQKVQIFVHTFTFTLKACKAFYVQRKSSECDPDPSFSMILLLFPLMLANVINSAAQWTVIAGHLKLYVFIPVFLMVCILWPLLKKKEQKENVTEEKCDNSKTESVNEKLYFRRVSMNENKSKDSIFDKVITRLGSVAADSDIDKGCFLLKASLTSVWVPCVVGNSTRTFFNSAFFSLILRSFVLLFIIIFSSLEQYPDNLRMKSYLLYCNTDAKMEELLRKYPKWNPTTCSSLEDCFKDSNNGTQLYRICGVGEGQEISMNITGILIHLFLFSLVSFYFLDRYTSYLHLYEVSKIWSSISPIIHRSLIFQLIQSGNHVKLQEICDIVKEASQSKNISDGQYIERDTKDEGSQIVDKDASCVRILLDIYDIIKEATQRKDVSDGESVERQTIDEGSEIVDEEEFTVGTILNRQCPKGCSPLHLAVLVKDASCVRILLESGAKVAQDSTPHHPLTSAFSTDLTCFNLMLKQASKTEIMKAFQQAVELNKMAYSLRLLNHNGSSLFYTSTNLLGEINGYQTIERFNVAGEGKRDWEIRSIAVNFNNTGWVTGLELVWSDEKKKVLGLAETDESVYDSKKVDAPEDASFSIVRGKTVNKFIVALAFDTVSSSGTVKHGEWIRSSQVNFVEVEKSGTKSPEVIDTLGKFEIGDNQVRCVLDGFKGRLDANLVDADVMNGRFDYRYFLSNLAVTYKMTSFSK